MVARVFSCKAKLNFFIVSSTLLYILLNLSIEKYVLKIFKFKKVFYFEKQTALMYCIVLQFYLKVRRESFSHPKTKCVSYIG